MKTAEILCILPVILTIGCSSAPVGGNIAPDAGAEVSAYGPETGPAEASGGPQDASDAPDDLEVQPDAPEPQDAPRGDAIPIGSDGAACPGNPPGDGGTVCILYAYQVDGAPLDEAGNPNGIGVPMGCAVGQPCTACMGGYGYAGMCE